MKVLFALPFFALAMVFVGDQPADDWIWTAPGWYGKADTLSISRIVSGPYNDEKSCMAQLPQSNPGARYTCAFLDDQPT